MSIRFRCQHLSCWSLLSRGNVGPWALPEGFVQQPYGAGEVCGLYRVPGGVVLRGHGDDHDKRLVSARVRDTSHVNIYWGHLSRDLINLRKLVISYMCSNFAPWSVWKFLLPNSENDSQYVYIKFMGVTNHFFASLANSANHIFRIVLHLNCLTLLYMYI